MAIDEHKTRTNRRTGAATKPLLVLAVLLATTLVAGPASERALALESPVITSVTPTTVCPGAALPPAPCTSGGNPAANLTTRFGKLDLAARGPSAKGRVGHERWRYRRCSLAVRGRVIRPSAPASRVGTEPHASQS